MNKTELKKAWLCRALSIAMGTGCLAVMTGAGLDASTTLWNNGAVTTGYDNTVRCDSGGGTCGQQGSSLSFTVFDNFTVGPIGWVVSGFVISDFFYHTPTSEYQSTNWSIWKGDPLTGGTLVAASSAVGVLANVNGSCTTSTICLETITVSFGTSVALTGGNTYYLGSSNVLKNSNAPNQYDETDRAYAAGNGLPGWEQSNGSIKSSSWGLIQGTVQGFSDNTRTFPSTDTAFDITGTLAPEPGSLTMIGLAMAGLGLGFRLRRQNG